MKENKNQYLIELKQQIHDQNEKLLRAGKNLKNTQKEIKKIFSTRGDHAVIVQQVCKLNEIFHSKRNKHLINMF